MSRLKFLNGATALQETFLLIIYSCYKHFSVKSAVLLDSPPPPIYFNKSHSLIFNKVSSQLNSYCYCTSLSSLLGDRTCSRPSLSNKPPLTFPALSLRRSRLLRRWANARIVSYTPNLSVDKHTTSTLVDQESALTKG